MGFEPTKPVWGLHDSQQLFKVLKSVDIHRVLSPNILVATARIAILNILVSGIYVTTVVVFPSSKVVSDCENMIIVFFAFIIIQHL